MTCLRLLFLKLRPQVEHHCSTGPNSVSNKTTLFYCRCDDQYGGLNCNFPDDTCHPNPCQNGGMCQSFRVNDKIDWKCLCPEGYLGFSCEHQFTCECRNGGSCNTDGTHCNCPPGYYGESFYLLILPNWHVCKCKL